MTTIARSAEGASAYSRSSYPAYRRAVAHTGNECESPTHLWNSTIDELLRIRNLEDDWDGAGSVAPHPALIDGAITLAQYLQATGAMRPDRAHASVNATVYFEWHRPLEYIEIEVVSPVEAEIRTVRKGSQDVEVVHLSR